MRLFFMFIVILNGPFMANANRIFLDTDYSSKVVVDDKTPQLMFQLQEKSKLLNIAKYSFGDIIIWVALQLIGQPYVGDLLERKSSEYLYISLTDTDCMLFIEEVLVVSNLIRTNKLTIQNLIKGIKLVRYHNLYHIAYCERNHYFKDWALSNIKNNLIFDVAYPLTKIQFPYKSDIISKKIKNNSISGHKDDLQCIFDREKYINNHSQKLGFIPLNLLPNYLNKIKNGDIIGIVKYPTTGDAIQHLGIAYVQKNNAVGLIHASSAEQNRKVVVTNNLMTYLRQFKNSQGIILLRGR